MQCKPDLTLLSTTTIEGLIIEKYARNLTIFRPLNKRRATVDALVDAFHEHDHAAIVGTGHARSIIDMRISGWPTTYSLSVFIFDNAYNTPEDMLESIALVMADGVAARMMGIMLRQFPLKLRQSSRIFFDDVTACQWLHERDQALTPCREPELARIN